MKNKKTKNLKLNNLHSELIYPLSYLLSWLPISAIYIVLSIIYRLSKILTLGIGQSRAGLIK